MVLRAKRTTLALKSSALHGARDIESIFREEERD
jgi:hypothetical protein